MTISERVKSQLTNITLDNGAGGSSCKNLVSSSTQGSYSSKMQISGRKKPKTKAPDNIFQGKKDLCSKGPAYIPDETCYRGTFNSAGLVPPGFETDAGICRLETVIDMLKAKFSTLKVKRQVLDAHLVQE